jgi:SAM-dependent methyltransferase
MTSRPDRPPPPRAYPSITSAWSHLAEYLGPRFDPRLTDEQQLRSFLDKEWTQLKPHFYEHSIGYLYDLTQFHFTGIKDRFFQTISEFTTEHGLTRIADIGCGVALDAQALLQAGHDIDAYDLDNPSLAYARWRLHQEHNAAHRIHHITTLDQHRYDLVYAVDVLGHTTSPEQLIDLMFRSGKYVALSIPPHDPHHRFGPADLHPGLSHERIIPVLNRHGELIRLATCGTNSIAIWKRHERSSNRDAEPAGTSCNGDGPGEAVDAPRSPAPRSRSARCNGDDLVEAMDAGRWSSRR